MILLWALIVAAELATIAAGAQAVHLLRKRDSRISWLQTQIDTEKAASASTQKQLDAQKILLQQAEAWLDAERAKLNPPAPPASPEPAPASAP